MASVNLRALQPRPASANLLNSESDGAARSEQASKWHEQIPCPRADEAVRLEALQAQIEELEAVRACYDEELSMAQVELDNLQFATAVVEAGGVGSGASVGSSVAAGAASAADVPALSGMLRLPGVQLAGAPVQLAFVLPRLGGAPSLQVHCSAPREQAGSLQQLADSIAAESAADGSPCLLLVADRLTEAARELQEAAAAAAVRQQAGAQAQEGAEGQQQGSVRSSAGGPLLLSRRCIVFHHIKNLNKRKAIVQRGSELRLGGWSKPGFPGIVLIEGEEGDVGEYLSRLRHMRWQSMAVRAEEDAAVGSQQELEAARLVPRGVQELGEDEMGRLAAAAREAGLGHLFREALKLGPASE